MAKRFLGKGIKVYAHAVAPWNGERLVTQARMPYSYGIEVVKEAMKHYELLAYGSESGTMAVHFRFPIY